MSKRLTDRDRLLSKLKHLNDSEVEEVLMFVSGIETNRSAGSGRDQTDDDLLVTLSLALENMRARQVFEWESVRRRAEARTTSTGFARR